MKRGRRSSENLYGPLQRKTFASALDLFLEQQMPQAGGPLTRAALVGEIQRLVERFHPPNANLRMGQVFWPAVAENEKQSYGKRIEKTRLQPVFLDLVSHQDILDLLGGKSHRDVRRQRCVRLFQQAQGQGGVLTQCDVATLLGVSNGTVSQDVRQWEKETGELAPRRGTIHDMGRSMTHKREICRKVLLEGKSIEQTARETRHSPDAITRYVKTYKRIVACLQAGLSPQATAFAVNVSAFLVYEYLSLAEEQKLNLKAKPPGGRT